MPLSQDEYALIADTFGSALAEAAAEHRRELAAALSERDARIADVERRLAALEPEVKDAAAASRHSLRYFGVHTRAVDYPRGAAVTFQGSLFVAARAITAGEDGPGAGGPWVLAIKSGQVPK